ncbi:hypothetical protein F511_15471 [Dorcoceras hygrometricum]|uniref:Uncharacterized protein n=1 Tax=Dorcoceras hygrometricum TaxID=472368 RepID=A0A2Z7B655_9LAMI|nr:hypothetical protein F511_15471 [Dorcoceras hygrometricum]
MANQYTDDEVFYFSNSEFTREGLINALNEMVHEYRKLSQTFEKIKAENGCLKNSSFESSTAQLEDTDSLQTELNSESETSSTSSSSSDSEQEEVHCFMANQTDDDEVFDFANSEFTREDLVQALNDMVHEYKTLSHTFKEIKAENATLLASPTRHMFRGNSDACVSTTVAILAITKTALLTSFHLTVFKGHRSAYADDVVVMSTVEDDIAKVLEETLALGVTETEQESQAFDEALFEEDFTRWLDDFVARHSEPALGSIHSVADKEVNMPIDDLLIQICDDLLLPVTAAEVTMLRLGAFSSSGDKGKAKLGEDDQVPDNAARKLFALICRDVEVLVQVRDRLMQAVVDFFASFSLNSLPDMDSLEDLKEKERLMLAWAETTTLAIARRQLYVLTKYRELLLRAVLEFYQRYLTPALPWSAMAVQVANLLSVAHSNSIEELKAQQLELNIDLVQSNSSLPAMDYTDSGDVRLAHFYSITNSSCWVRPVFLMNEVWTPVQGPEFWSSSCNLSLFLDHLQMPAPAVQEIFPPHISFVEPDQYWATVPWLMRIWRWTKVCEEIVAFNLSGGLRPVRKDASYAITVHNLGVERIPANFLRLFAQGLACNNFVDSVVKKDLGDTEEVVLSGTEEVDLVSSDVSTVYRSPSPPSPGENTRHHDVTIIFSLNDLNRHDDVSSAKTCKWKDMMTSSVLIFAIGYRDKISQQTTLATAIAKTLSKYSQSLLFIESIQSSSTRRIPILLIFIAVGGISEKDSVPARADVVDKEISTVDDVDNIIEQVNAETAQFETDVGGTNVGKEFWGSRKFQRDDEMEHCDTDEEIVTDKVTEIDAGETSDGEQAVQRSDEKEKDAESGASKKSVVAKQNEEPLSNKPTDEELISCRLSLFVNKRQLPVRAIEDNFVPHCYFIEPAQYWGASQSIIKTWGWFKVCTEAVQFFESGKLLPVGSLTFCRTLAVYEPVLESGYRKPTVTSWGWSQLCTAFVRYSLFGGLQTIDIRNFLSVLIPDRPVLRYATILDTVVQRAPVFLLTYTSTQEDPIVQMDIDQHPDSSPTSTDSSFHFNANDIPTEEDSAHDRFILPSTSTPTTTDIAASFPHLRETIDQVKFEQIRRKDDMDRLKDILLMHIRDLEKQFSERFDQQDRANRVLLNSIRQEIHDQKNLLSLDFLTSQKRLSTQAQENYNNLTTQLGELVDYINHGGNEKKGEESSSRRPQPPPDDQNRPSGGSASRGGGGSGGSRRRDDRRDSSKKRPSSSGGGYGTGGETYGPYRPYKNNAEWWLYGKNQF